MPDEFRVVWQREGRRRQTRIFQSWDAACRKFAAIVAADAAKTDTHMDTLPDLVGVPVIESRKCEPWAEHEYQPPPEPSDSVVRELAFRWGPNAGPAFLEPVVPGEIPF